MLIFTDENTGNKVFVHIEDVLAVETSWANGRQYLRVKMKYNSQEYTVSPYFQEVVLKTWKESVN